MDTNKFQKEDKKSFSQQEVGGKKVAPPFMPKDKKVEGSIKQKTNEKDMPQSQDRKLKEQNRPETRN